MTDRKVVYLVVRLGEGDWEEVEAIFNDKRDAAVFLTKWAASRPDNKYVIEDWWVF